MQKKKSSIVWRFLGSEIVRKVDRKYTKLIRFKIKIKIRLFI